MLYAGLRKSEALALTVSDVNFRTRQIFVQPWEGEAGWEERRTSPAAQRLHEGAREATPHRRGARVLLLHTPEREHG
jgi:integrase